MNPLLYLQRGNWKRIRPVAPFNAVSIDPFIYLKHSCILDELPLGILWIQWFRQAGCLQVDTPLPRRSALVRKLSTPIAVLYVLVTRGVELHDM